jgi:hypothetical protein
MLRISIWFHLVIHARLHWIAALTYSCFQAGSLIQVRIRQE